MEEVTWDRKNANANVRMQIYPLASLPMDATNVPAGGNYEKRLR